MTRLTLISLMMLIAGTAFGAKTNYKMAAYDRWARLDYDVLMKKGFDYFSHSQGDSALICFTIVANRYYEYSQSEEQKYTSVSAYIALSEVYLFSFFDFEKAYNSAATALSLASKEHFSNLFPGIYQQKANMLLLSSTLYHPSEAMKRQTIALFKKAYYTAIKAKEWTIANAAIVNMTDFGFEREYYPLYANERADLRRRIPGNATLGRYGISYVMDAMDAFHEGNYRRVLNITQQVINGVKSGRIQTKGIDRTRLLASFSATRAKAYAAMGEYENAVATLQPLIDSLNNTGDKDILVQIYRDLARFHRMNGDSLEAQRYDLLYYKGRDEMLITNKLSDVEGMAFQSDLRRVNEQVQQLSERRYWQNILLVVALGVIAVISMLLIIIVRKNKRLRERNHLLYLKSIEALKTPVAETPAAKKKYVNSSLHEEEKALLVGKISKAMEDTAFVCSEEMSLNKLAEVAGSNYKSVLQVINEQWGKNFNQLLADYRIREACRRFNDAEHYGSMTIEAVGASVGFRSRSNFVTTFKRIIGLTPSEYLKEC